MKKYVVETRSGRIEEVWADGLDYGLRDGQYIVSFYVWNKRPTMWKEGDRDFVAEYLNPNGYRVVE